MNTSADELAKAKRSAYRLIKYRDRSRKEIGDSLMAKGYSSDICANVTAELQRFGYINDTRLANMLAENILRFKPSAIKLIRSKLYSRGIPADIIDSVAAAVKEGYNESESAYKLAAMKTERMRGVQPHKAKQRIYGFLSRRRFSQNVIIEVLNKLF